MKCNIRLWGKIKYFLILILQFYKLDKFEKKLQRESVELLIFTRKLKISFGIRNCQKRLKIYFMKCVTYFGIRSRNVGMGWKWCKQITSCRDEVQHSSKKWLQHGIKSKTSTRQIVKLGVLQEQLFRWRIEGLMVCVVPGWQ